MPPPPPPPPLFCLSHMCLLNSSRFVSLCFCLSGETMTTGEFFSRRHVATIKWNVEENTCGFLSRFLWHHTRYFQVERENIQQEPADAAVHVSSIRGHKRDLFHPKWPNPRASEAALVEVCALWGLFSLKCKNFSKILISSKNDKWYNNNNNHCCQNWR